MSLDLRLPVNDPRLTTDLADRPARLRGDQATTPDASAAQVPATRLQSQRLRRDPPLPVRVGRQAAGGQLRRRGTRSRFQREPARGHQPRGGGVVPESHARLGWDAEAGRLVRTVGRRRARGRVEPPDQVRRTQEIPQDLAAKDSIKAFGKLVEVVDGRPQLISDPPMIVRLEELVGSRESPADRGRTAGHPSFLPSHAVRRSPAPAGGLPIRRRCPQGGRGRKRRHPGLDHVDGRQRRQRPVVPPGQGGPDLRPRAVPGRRVRIHTHGQRVVEGTTTHAVGQ